MENIKDETLCNIITTVLIISNLIIIWTSYLMFSLNIMFFIITSFIIWVDVTFFMLSRRIKTIINSTEIEKIKNN